MLVLFQGHLLARNVSVPTLVLKEAHGPKNSDSPRVSLLGEAICCVLSANLAVLQRRRSDSHPNRRESSRSAKNFDVPNRRRR
jgi:hypothetical protein